MTIKKATLLFLVKDNQILLAMKKRGFGEGKWNGVGGKPEGQETIEQTAARECEEEIRVRPVSFHETAILNFTFPPKKADYNQQVIVYFCTKWEGEPQETKEMRPEWFNIGSIPYDNMWSDDIYWLPKVLNGDFVIADFEFDEQDNVLNQKVAARNPL